MASAVFWLIGSVAMFVMFGAVASSASASKRRSRFYVRLACASLVALILALGLGLAINANVLPQGAAGAAWLALLLAALAVVPVFCYHTFAPFKGPSDGDDGGGGGGGPSSGPPPIPPDPPSGGALLPDADQARARRRDHNRPSLGSPSPRRGTAEPVRPVRRRRAPAGATES